MKFLKQWLIVPVLLAFFFGCTPEDQKKLEEVKIYVASPEFNTTINFTFIDATTGSLIRDNQVTLTFDGASSEKLVDMSGKFIAELKSVDGFANAMVNPKNNPTDGKPLELLVTAKASGYLTLKKRIVIGEEGAVTESIKLVSSANPPAGVTIIAPKSVQADVTGKTLSEISLAAPDGKAEVVVPKNAILKDKDGSPVTGNVTAEVVYYQADEQAALESFPGGLDTQVKGPDGEVVDGNFFSAGLFDIELTAGGKKVAEIEGEGLKIKSKAASDIYNPETGQEIAAGDSIGLWSYNDETGIWTYEQTGYVKNEGGELTLEAEIPHLSYWNWDFHMNSCYYGPEFIFNGPAKQNFYIKMYTSSFNAGYYYSYSKSTYLTVIPGDAYYGNTRIYNAPRSTPMTFYFEDASGDANIEITPSSVQIQDLCNVTASTPITISYKNPALAPQKVRFDLSATCITKPNVIIQPSAWIYITPKGTWNYKYYYMRSGKMEADFQFDKEYTVYVYVNGRAFWSNIKIVDSGTNYIVYLDTTFTGKDYIQIPIPKSGVDADGFIVVKASFELDEDQCKALGI